MEKGLKLNPYDGCIANKTVNGKQITICFHVDDCKISHESTKVVDKLIDWLREGTQRQGPQVSGNVLGLLT